MEQHPAAGGRQGEGGHRLRRVDHRVDRALGGLSGEAVGPGLAGQAAEHRHGGAVLERQPQLLGLGEPACVLVAEQVEVAVVGVHPAAARELQQQHALPADLAAEVAGAGRADHEAGAVEAVEREALGVVLRDLVVGVDVLGAPEPAHRHVGRAGIAGVEAVEALQPALVQALDHRLVGAGLGVALLQAVVGDQHHLRMLLAEVQQGRTEGGAVHRADLGGEQGSFQFRGGDREVEEVELEQADAACVPPVQRLHEVGEEAAVEQAGGRPGGVHRVAPLREDRHLRGVQGVAADPQARQDSQPGAGRQPGVAVIVPVRPAPGAVAAVAGVPEGVDQVVVEADALAAQPHQLVELAHGEGLGQLDVVRQFIVGRPVDVDRDGMLDHASQPDASAPPRQFPVCAGLSAM